MNIIAALLGLIFFLVIIGVLFWGIQKIISALPIAEPWLTMINVILVVVGVIVAIFVCIWLLNLAGVHVAMPRLGG